MTMKSHRLTLRGIILVLLMLGLVPAWADGTLTHLAGAEMNCSVQ